MVQHVEWSYWNYFWKSKLVVKLAKKKKNRSEKFHFIATLNQIALVVRWSVKRYCEFPYIPENFTNKPKKFEE